MIRREVILLLLLTFASIACPLVLGFTLRSPSAAVPISRAPPLFTGSISAYKIQTTTTNERRQWHDLSRMELTSFLWRRLDTLETAGIKDVALTSGAVFDRIKSMHNPKFYLGVAALAMLKWKSLFRNYFYWFIVAFLVKWYRARYVFKIPVWDRQPNWNNVITSKEQEKDLKAFTCKKCGSTIFIAKSREFFFEGGTGIGGLGCFTCGAKGKENFVMDRDRIVKDVADEDDYFDYEKPLDFVSRAERKKLLKETGGDESKANRILLERAAGESPVVGTPNVSSSDPGTIDAVIEGKETQEPSATKAGDSGIQPLKSDVSLPPPSATPKNQNTNPPSKGDDDGLDALDMDAF